MIVLQFAIAAFILCAAAGACVIACEQRGWK